MAYKILVGLCLILLVLARRTPTQLAEEAAQDEKTVVQANHFFSNTEKSTTYDIGNVEKDKPLVYLLKPGDKKDEDLANNSITITLIQGSEQVKCKFVSFNNLCALKNITKDEVKAKIQCQKLPCELSWIIYQPPKDSPRQTGQLTAINQKLHHATLLLSCNDPNVPNFANDVKLFSNSKYQKVISHGQAFYLFQNEEPGYYYLNTQNEAAAVCAVASLKHSADTVQFNLQNNFFEDFALKGKQNRYTITTQPETDFRMDAFFHSPQTDLLSQNEGVQINLIGQTNNNQEKTLRKIFIYGSNKKNQDFSIIFKKPTQKFKQLFIDIKSLGQKTVVVNMDFVTSQRQEVNLGQVTYFDLKKGQKINFKLLPEKQQTSQQRLTYILVEKNETFKTSLKQCKTKSGCQFDIQALGDGATSIFFGDQAQRAVNQNITINFDHHITKKLRQSQTLSLRTRIKPKKAFQAVVNSPNVIIYAATRKKCPVLSAECHQKVINSYNPIIYEPQEQQQTDLFFLVQALDNCEFTLTLIDQGSQYIQLKDSIPFTYLFDDGQKQLTFKFTLPEKIDVNFNLIAPLNQLYLIVYNRQSIDKKTQGDISTDGYYSVPKSEIKSKTFIIKVQKLEQFLKKYIHFTLMVSTKEGNIRLQPAVSHYQTLAPEETRDFVFQFEPKKDILINFYTYNIVSSINLKITVSTSDSYSKKDDQIQYEMNTEVDVIDLKDVAKQLCKQVKQAQNCQLFIRMKNQMEVDIDVTVSLLMKDAVMELKDGIWNSYQINSIAQNSHFFFLPKHQNKSITVFYDSDLVDLKMMYTLWKTDDHSINPSEWPFPDKSKINKKDSLKARPTKFIHIAASQLNKCWPNCVVLVSIFKDQTSLANKYKSFSQTSFFKIMASNNYIQIPQNQKIDIVMQKDQDKYFLVDLKYAVKESKALTFFTYFTIGSVHLSANVYDESDPRCPKRDEETDFKFGNVQTQIAIQSIKKKLSDYDMDLDKDPSICILAHAYLDSKFSVQYTSKDDIIKQLMIDSFYTEKLGKQPLFLQIDATQQFTLKLTRTSGFPYIETKKCKQGDDLQSCLDDFKESNKQQVQFAEKIMSYAQQPCSKCILFLKMRAEDPAEVNLHVQSKYAETQLIENQIITDQVEKQEQNKYLLTTVDYEEVVINIQIMYGDLEVFLTDWNKISINKTNEDGSTSIHITIPAKDGAQKKSEVVEDQFGLGMYESYQYSIFNNLHMTIKSKDSKAKALYTVTYSSGELDTYLQDGLVTQYVLIPNATSKFIYKNPRNSPIYLHLSTNDSQVLNKLKVTIFALNNQNDEESGVQITPQKPNFPKKTPNPTMIMTLPANKFFVINVKTQQKTYQFLTIAVNNQEIVYLPFNYEYPVRLGANQHIYIVVPMAWSSPSQYALIDIKKCDQNGLFISHTVEYDNFVREQFGSQQEMTSDELETQIQIKSKEKDSKAVYIKFQSPSEQVSVFTVKAAFTYQKSRPEKPRAGNNGLIQYRQAGDSKFQFTISSVSCPPKDKACKKDFKYTSIISDKPQNIYAQLVCSSIAFDIQDRQIINNAKTDPITSITTGDTISFTEQATGDITFVGVRGVNNKTGDIIYYKPVQIATMIGWVNKQTKKSHPILWGILIVVVLLIALLAYRRSRRQSQYEQLGAQE